MNAAAAMHLMSYRGFSAEVALDADLGVFVGSLLDVPDPVQFQARRLASLPGCMARAVDEYIALRQEWGLPCPRPFSGDRSVRFGAVGDSA